MSNNNKNNFKLLTSNPQYNWKYLLTANLEDVKEQTALIKKYSIPFEIIRLYSLWDGRGKEKSNLGMPLIIVDKKYIPESDFRSVRDIDYSVQCSGLKGHPMINIDLQNPQTQEQTHFIINFCPMEWAGSSESYSQFSGFIETYSNTNHFMITDREFANRIDYMQGIDFKRILQNKDEKFHFVVVGRMDYRPLADLENLWINFVKNHPVLNSVKNFDLYNLIINEMDKMFLGLDISDMCKSCERILKEIK
jgi:hypothetical protein